MLTYLRSDNYSDFIFSVSHEWLVCKQPCRYVRPCCEIACTRTCGEPHAHGCDCISEIKGNEAVDESKVDQSIAKFTESVLSNNLTRAAHHGLVPRRNVPFQRQSVFDKGRIISPYAGSPNINPDVSGSRNEQLQTEGQRKWNEFASGGAREIDQCLDVLCRAKDFDPEEVKRALGRVDSSFIPIEFARQKHLLDLEDAQRSAKQEEDSGAEGKERDSGGKEEKEEYHDVNQYTQSDVLDEKNPSVV